MFSLDGGLLPPSMYPGHDGNDTNFCTGSIYIPGHNTSGTDYPGTPPVSHVWTVMDCLLMVVIVFGNSLTITAVRTNRKLSNVISNQFIVNLALSDLFLGCTLPYHMAFYLCVGLGHHKATCLLRFVIISFACTSSVYNLIAIAVDRYIAIVHPLHYCRYMTERLMRGIMLGGWVLAVVISTVSIYWNTWEEAVVCELDEVLQKYYLSLVLLPAFLLVWLAMFVFYWRIWRAAAGQAKRMRDGHGGGAGESVSDKKSIQVVLLVLGCFSVCWFPFFTVAILRSYDMIRTPQTILLYKGTFSLAMANSGMNPVIYAWKNSEFKATFGRLLRCRPGDGHGKPFKPSKLRSNPSAAGSETVRSEASARGPKSEASEASDAATVPREVVIVADEGAIVARGNGVAQTEL